jgi:hypothetical protein
MSAVGKISPQVTRSHLGGWRKEPVMAFLGLDPPAFHLREEAAEGMIY